MCYGIGLYTCIHYVHKASVNYSIKIMMNLGIRKVLLCLSHEIAFQKVKTQN